MFVFSAWETLFMVSMAMSYFYSWQTYSIESAEVTPVELREVFRHTAMELRARREWICQTRICQGLHALCGPILAKLEGLFGRGGNLAAGQRFTYKGDGAEDDRMNSFSAGRVPASPRQRNFDFEDDDDELLSFDDLKR